MSEETHPQNPTLLLVDDDDAFRAALASALDRRGFHVTAVSNAADALVEAARTTFEYAVVDVRMPGMDGIELVGRLHAIDDGTRIVVMTGYATIANAVAAMQKGAVDYVSKPVDAESVERALTGVARAAETRATDIPSLDLVEWEYLQRVLADCGGNISDAARRLRIHRRSLQRKLNRRAPTR
jgi:two-component system response regulator RegA